MGALQKASEGDGVMKKDELCTQLEHSPKASSYSERGG